MRQTTLIAGLLCLAFSFTSCFNNSIHKSVSYNIKEIKHPFLKAHMYNGDLYVFGRNWRYDAEQDVLIGSAQLYNANRNLQYSGESKIKIDDVAIFESNAPFESKAQQRISALTIMTGINVAIAGLCVTNPKACFGSCPTFYLNEEDNFHYADAEGFSNAISPALSYADIDALPRTNKEDSMATLFMKNEALETHCIKKLNLLSVDVEANQEALHLTSNNFIVSELKHSPISASHNKKDIKPLINQDDRKELFISSDSTNLRSKTEIYLDFETNEVPDSLALELHFRQSMLTTYLIYSGLDYMGDKTGEYFAEIERSKLISDQLKKGIQKELGGIEVYGLSENGSWKKLGVFNETGPIAINRQAIYFENCSKDNLVQLKLVLNKGLWRLDYAALHSKVKKVKAKELEAYEILKAENDDFKSAEFSPINELLLSLPSDKFKITFNTKKPLNKQQLFLKSEGYYLEWIRDEWAKEARPKKLRELILYPKRYLKQEAKTYSELEFELEQDFWNSKIESINFNSYE